MLGFKNRPDANSQKYKKFRQRPHANPLADLPIILPCSSPQTFPFALYYTDCRQSSQNLNGQQQNFDYVDIGCGYGDFVVKMSKIFIKSTFLGLEIRDKAAAIAQQQILDQRSENKVCGNAAVIQCNVSRQLPRLLAGGSVTAFTVMFPDPDFKQSKERRRVLQRDFCKELHFYLKNDGFLLICTDVKELFEFMMDQLQNADVLASKDERLCYCQQFLLNLNQTADAQRHLKKDQDQTIYEAVWQKI